MNYSITKKLITGITATALLLTAGIPAAMAEEEAPTADASVGLYSKYVWRGFELSKDSLVIQPSLSVSYMGFGANLWANLDTDLYGADTNKWGSVRVFCKTEDYWGVKDELTRQVKEGLDEAGIGIPYPHQVIISQNA